MPNPRVIGGPKEGKPGEFVIVTVTDVLPPRVYNAIVQGDGYFDDALYEEIDTARREYRRERLREDDQ